MSVTPERYSFLLEQMQHVAEETAVVVCRDSRISGFVNCGHKSPAILLEDVIYNWLAEHAVMADQSEPKDKD